MSATTVEPFAIAASAVLSGPAWPDVMSTEALMPRCVTGTPARPGTAIAEEMP